MVAAHLPEMPAGGSTTFTYCAEAGTRCARCRGTEERRCVAIFSVSGIGAATPITPGVGYTHLTYTFTATATSHELALSYDAAGVAESTVWWDDITVTKDAWAETIAVQD